MIGGLKTSWQGILAAAAVGALSGVLGGPAVTPERVPTADECRAAGHVARPVAGAPSGLFWNSPEFQAPFPTSPAPRWIVHPAFPS